MTDYIDNRQIRVFISSTFKDMQEERTYLINNIFPRLRKMANERDVSLVELDLRWGITEEEAREGKVMQICLDEIDNSHPFFIGLLGDRYGWCPTLEDISGNKTLKERYPWVIEDIQNGSSVTEIEMQYGVLRRTSEKLNAFFYLKPDTVYTEPRQRMLKDCIRKTSHYPIAEFSSLEELGNKVENEFINLIETLFPQKELSIDERDRLSQRIFFRSRSNVYIPNEEYYEILDNFINDEQSQHLVITGESGMGKSALMANWMLRRKKTHNDKIIYHFVGNSTDEGDYNLILRHLINEIRTTYNVEYEINSQLNSQKDNSAILQELLNKINDEFRLILILDGINQLHDKEDHEAKLLKWLPDTPSFVKIIFTTLENDETMQTFSRRSYPIFKIGPLNFEQRCKLINDYLRRYGKGLLPEQTKRIAESKLAHNTLVLKTIIDEMINFGVHEELDRRIEYYLSATSNEKFFQKVLKRLEDDFGEEEVRTALALIALSYAGMGEKELMEIGNINQLQWSRLYCSILSHLTIRNGLINFSHQYLKEAVESRYLNASYKNESQDKIINYFRKRESSLRDWLELSHQYLTTTRLEDLYTFILSPQQFNYLSFQHYYIVIKIWRELLKNKYSLSDYLNIGEKIQDKRVAAAYFRNAGRLSERLHFPQISTPLFEKSVELYKEIEEKEGETYKVIRLNTMIELAQIYHKDKIHYHPDREILEEVVEEFKELSSTKPELVPSYAYALTSLGLNLIYIKPLVAEKHFIEALKIYTTTDRKFFEGSISNIIEHLALIHKNAKQYDKAENEYKEAIEIAERLYKRDPYNYGLSLAVLLYSLGSLYLNCLNRQHEAEILLNRSLRIGKDLDQQHERFEINMPYILRDLAKIYESRHDYINQEKIYQQILDIERRKAENHPGRNELFDVSISLKCIAEIHHLHLGELELAKCEYLEAINVYNRILKEDPDVGDLDWDLALSYLELGKIEKELGNFERSLEYLKIALSHTGKRNFLKSTHANILYEIGNLYRINNKYEDARANYNQALSLFLKLSEKRPKDYQNQISEIEKDVAHMSVEEMKSKSFINKVLRLFKPSRNN